jgi:hypothetical protein
MYQSAEYEDAADKVDITVHSGAGNGDASEYGCQPKRVWKNGLEERDAFVGACFEQRRQQDEVDRQDLAGPADTGDNVHEPQHEDQLEHVWCSTLSSGSAIHASHIWIDARGKSLDHAVEAFVCAGTDAFHLDALECLDQRIIVGPELLVDSRE